MKMETEDVQSQSDESEFEFSTSTDETIRKDFKGEKSLITGKSYDKYMHSYNTFMQWKRDHHADALFSEKLFMEFFNEKSKIWKPTTLWSQYSMLRSTIIIHHNINISAFKEVRDFLKYTSKGYRSKKAKVFSTEDINKFITKAPDYDYLAAKVILIFGVAGSCKNNELPKVKVKDVESHGNIYLVKISKSSSGSRSFTITEEYAKFVKKYEALRPSNAMTERFFLNYHRGKCSVQVIGINTFAKIPLRIAEYLELPNPELYTGHSFRRTSVSILTDCGANMTLPLPEEKKTNTEKAECFVDPVHIKEELHFEDEEEGDNDSEEDPLGTEIELRDISNREIKIPKRGVVIKMTNCVNCTIRFEK